MSFRLSSFRTASVSKPLPKPKQEIPQRTAPKPPLPYSGNVASPTSPGATATTPLNQTGPPIGGSDYDSPWEWKVNKVEQEFEKRFSVAGDANKPTVAPRSGTVGKRPAAPPPPINNQNINPIPKPHRTNPPPPVPTTPTIMKEKEYQVDPTIPLENQGYLTIYFLYDLYQS